MSDKKINKETKPVVKKEMITNGLEDAVAKSFKTVLPQILKDNGRIIVQTSLQGAIDDLIEASIKRVIKDSEFTKCLDETIKKVVSESFKLLDQKKMITYLQDTMECALNDFEFCNLASPLEKKLRETIQNLSIISTGKAKDKTKS